MYELLGAIFRRMLGSSQFECIPKVLKYYRSYLRNIIDEYIACTDISMSVRSVLPVLYNYCQCRISQIDG